MAKFGENILEYKDARKFSRIPVTCVGDQWFIMSGKNSVMNVQNSKTLRTWTLVQGHLHYFSTTVAYFDGNLYAVMDNNILIRWSVDDDNLEKAEKIELPEYVHTIIPLHGAQPMLIFKSGKFLMIGTNTCDLKPSDSICVKDTDFLDWADATISEKNIEVFYLVFDKEAKTDILYYFTINKEDKSVSPFHTYNIIQENASFKGCCLNHQDLSFLSLWSDGTIRCYSVKDSKDIPLLSIQDIGKDTIEDINSIDSTHIVVAKSKSRNGECVLEIWDSKGVVLKGRKDLKIPHLNFLQIAAIDDHLFINFIVKIVAIPFVVDSTFFSTLNTSEGKRFQQHSWNMDLELLQIPASDEPEKMDASPSNQDSEDSAELVVEKLLNQDSPDLMFIPESELVKILQLVISHKKDENSGQKCFGKDMYTLLNIILSASFNDTLLVKYLKRLNAEDTLIVLDLLLSYLKHTVNMPTDILDRPSDLQIVNWLCLMISSHTETLLFTKERAAKKLLKDLKKALSIKMDEYEDLEGIQSYFSILQKKDILPQQYSVEKYCLETLDV